MQKSLLIGAVVIGSSVSSLAFADGDGSDAAGAGASVGASATVGGSASAGGTVGATVGVGAEVAAPRWPQAVFDRPLTLPAGLLLAGPDLDYVYTSVSASGGGITVNGSINAEILALTAGYGITDDLEINTIAPNYVLLLNESAGGSSTSSGKGPFNVGAGYKLIHGAAGGKLDVIARVYGGYNFGASAGLPISVGVQVKYNVTPKFAIVSHDNGSGNAGFSFGTSGNNPISATIPIGVALQALPALWVEADTNIFSSINISNSTTTSISDVQTVNVTGIYNTMDGRLDLRGYLGLNYASPNGGSATQFTIGVGARYYIGNVK